MNKDRQTLVILTPGFPASETDTTCLPAQQLFVTALNRHFPDLSVIILAFHYPFSNAAYTWNTNRVIGFNGRSLGKLHRLVLWYRVWRMLRKLRKEHHLYGMFSFWCTECALIGKYFGRLNHLPHYCWILGQDAKKKNKFVRLIRPRAGELVAMSDFLEGEFYRNHGIRPGHVIPNGIEENQAPGEAIERNIDIMGAGSLIPLKNYRLFIAVVEEIAGHLPAVRSLICGKGPEMETLQDCIRSSGLENTVTLAGEQAHPEVLRRMRSSKVFLHTSSYEGFSTVCLEALYAGAHVISFCKPMNRQIKHWHVVHSAKEMVQTVLGILQSPGIDHEPVMAYSMSDSAIAVMKLFAQQSFTDTIKGAGN